MDTTTTENKEVKVTLRVSLVLYGRVKAEVEKRKVEVATFSINDWIKEAIRARLDGTLTASSAPPRPEVQKVAAQIPGVRAGIPQPKPKGWMSELLRLKDLKEVDPEEAGREEARILQGFKPPKGWNYLDLEHRAAHLDAVMPIGGQTHKTTDW